MAQLQKPDMEVVMVDNGPAAQRITPAHIDSIIVAKHFFNAGEGVVGSMICASVESGNGIVLPDGAAELIEPIRRTTVCLLVLKNSAQVIGINYGPVSHENWDPEVARELAEKDARNKIWELEGYLMRQNRYEQQQEQEDIASALADFNEADCVGCKI